MNALDIIIPIYNEELSLVQETIRKVREAFASINNVKIYVVNDGSDDKYNLDLLKNEGDIIYLRHEVNQGYGRALKTGISSGSAPWIAITDSDGTYPVEDLPLLVQNMDNADMVVGTRVGEIREIPLMRRFPKKMLNILASYMAGIRITDLNSGLRVFTRSLCYNFWGLLPPRFSFTSTLTMAAQISGYRVKEEPINYFKRTGSSSIHPIKDTLRFINIIIRLGVLFHPMKLFAPFAFLLFFAGFIKGILRDFLFQGYVGNLSIMLMIAGFQVILMGYLGELIVCNRRLTHENLPEL